MKINLQHSLYKSFSNTQLSPLNLELIERGKKTNDASNLPRFYFANFTPSCKKLSHQRSLNSFFFLFFLNSNAMRARVLSRLRGGLYPQYEAAMWRSEMQSISMSTLRASLPCNTAMHGGKRTQRSQLTRSNSSEQ